MTGSTLYILVAVGAVGVGYLFLRRRGSLSSLRLGSLFPSKPEDEVARLEAETERERETVERLRAVLEAKKGLAEARAETAQIRKEIAGLDSPASGKKQAITKRMQ